MWRAVCTKPAAALREAVDVIVAGVVDEACRLSRIHLFVENAVEEGIIDVELVRRPVSRHGQGEHGAHCRHLDDWTVRFTIVDAGSLCETTYHPSCLVAVEVAVLLELLAEHPFAADDVGTGRPRNELPGGVAEERIELQLHR